MKITIDIPDAEWARMLTRAEAHGEKLTDLLRRAIERAIPDEWVRSEVIVRLVVEGVPDAVIAERLGMSKAYVGEVRRRAGLPPNRFQRATWAHEFKRQAA